MTTKQPLLTVNEVAAQLQISSKHLYRLTAQKRIPHLRVGGSLRFRQEEIDAWLAAKSHKAVS